MAYVQIDVDQQHFGVILLESDTGWRFVENGNIELQNNRDKYASGQEPSLVDGEIWVSFKLMLFQKCHLIMGLKYDKPIGFSGVLHPWRWLTNRLATTDGDISL